MNEALKTALEEFRNICFEDIPKRCNVSLMEGKIKIKYLNKLYLVSPNEIITLDGKEEVKDREKTIVLHYLTLSKGTQPTGELIDFREIPGGTMYYSVFEKRVYEPFLRFFGENSTLFVKGATSLGGERINFGDIAFRFMVLPHIPVNFILHRGDGEFSPACKVLFDSNISDHLPTEDIVVVCEYIVEELRECSRNLSSINRATTAGC